MKLKPPKLVICTCFCSTPLNVCTQTKASGDNPLVTIAGMLIGMCVKTSVYIHELAPHGYSMQDVAQILLHINMYNQTVPSYIRATKHLQPDSAILRKGYQTSATRQCHLT